MDGELKKNINEVIKDLSDGVKRIKMRLKPDNKAFDAIMEMIKYKETETRYHRTSLMILEAAAQNKPKSVLESIIKKRLEYMSILMELQPTLVEYGVTPEQKYLQACKEFKEEYQHLQADMENY